MKVQATNLKQKRNSERSGPADGPSDRRGGLAPARVGRGPASLEPLADVAHGVAAEVEDSGVEDHQLLQDIVTADLAAFGGQSHQLATRYTKS